MSPISKLTREIVVGMAMLACAGASHGQEDSGAAPKPAAREYPPLIDTGEGNHDVTTDEGVRLKPDTGPLTGVQNPTMGTPDLGHSYWVPGFQYSNAVSSRSQGSFANNGWNSASYLTGNLSLLESWRNATVALNYSGGGYFTTDDSVNNGIKTRRSGQLHQAGLSYQLSGRRWQFQILDQFSYLPETTYGFGASTGLSMPGVGGTLGGGVTGLQGGLVPNQSVFTAIGPRYSNSGALQWTFQTSARGSITVAGVYAILRFIESGNVEMNNPGGSAGYNYVVSKKDTVGFLYHFSGYQFAGDPQAFGDHTAYFVYGRKITGRTALRLSGGPEYTQFRVPVNGKSSRISGSGGATVSYAFERGSVNVNYQHGLTGGSGVLAGSDADLVGAQAGHRLGRTWTGSLNLSYARNRQIGDLGGTASPTFSSWIAGAELDRALGRDASVSLAYQAQLEDRNAAACGTTGCSSLDVLHRITLNVQWHTRPLVLR